ncbi:MAG: hypothetical protein VB138_03930 [Burkholderia sp.]
MIAQTSPQRGPIELAIGIERQRIERDRLGRHHVIGQRGERRAPHDKGRQPRAGRRLIGQHGRRAHAIQLGESVLDLGRLDAITADLDLVVGAPAVFEQAVGAEPGQVMGNVIFPRE